MRIGIKYCGGCNPCYDRTALLERLRARYPNVAFVPADVRGMQDLTIVLCGCSRLCAYTDAPAGKGGKLALTRAADYDKLVDCIDVAMNGIMPRDKPHPRALRTQGPP